MTEAEVNVAIVRDAEARRAQWQMTELLREFERLNVALSRAGLDDLQTRVAVAALEIREVASRLDEFSATTVDRQAGPLSIYRADMVIKNP
jgi:hypothetical protein